MTDGELRVKVATALGWIAVKYDAGIAIQIHTDPDGCLVGISPVVQAIEHGKDESKTYNYLMVPLFSTDLNACAAFEQSLSEDEREKYLDAISSEVDFSLFDGVCATARQRCLAFLKVKGVL